jgi:hypothetical protein
MELEVSLLLSMPLRGGWVKHLILDVNTSEWDRQVKV